MGSWVYYFTLGRQIFQPSRPVPIGPFTEKLICAVHSRFKRSVLRWAERMFCWVDTCLAIKYSATSEIPVGFEAMDKNIVQMNCLFLHKSLFLLSKQVKLYEKLKLIFWQNIKKLEEWKHRSIVILKTSLRYVCVIMPYTCKWDK